MVPNGNAAATTGATATAIGGAQPRVATTTPAAPPEQDFLDDQPLYVNAKQYHRILKRRQQRAKLEAAGKIPKERRVGNFVRVGHLFL